MLGLRYHVASLAAVFLALAVGILLGVAISGKVSEAEDSLQRKDIERLEQSLKNARAASDSAEKRGEAAQDLLDEAYPALMENRLEQHDVAVLFLGPVDGSVRSSVERTLADAGASTPARLIALDVPVNALDLQDTLQGSSLLAAYAGEDGQFGDLGRALGHELVTGGDAPLWTALSSELVEERSGGLSAEVDGVVVMYTWTAGSQSDSDDAEAEARTRATRSLFEGIVGGLDGSGVPVVGVAGTEDSAGLTALYREQGISSVDDVDTLAGKLALALLLEGGEPGQYGIKDSATDGVTPPIDSVPPPGG